MSVLTGTPGRAPARHVRAEARARPEGGGTPRAIPMPKRRNRWLPATLVGLLIGLVVALGGIALIGSQQKQYAATASLLVLPDRAASGDTVASLYDSLSSGQVIESYRAVMSSAGFGAGVLDSLGLSPRDRAGVVPDVHVVPSTALIDATVVADSPEVAERVADAYATRATRDLSATFAPYRITAISPATGTAEESGPGSRTLIGVVVLVALVVAVAAQQAVLFGVQSRDRARARRSRPRGTAEGSSSSGSSSTGSSSTGSSSTGN